MSTFKGNAATSPTAKTPGRLVRKWESTCENGRYSRIGYKGTNMLGEEMRKNGN